MGAYPLVVRTRVETGAIRGVPSRRTVGVHRVVDSVEGGVGWCAPQGCQQGCGQKRGAETGECCTVVARRRGHAFRAQCQGLRERSGNLLVHRVTYPCQSDRPEWPVIGGGMGPVPQGGVEEGSWPI